MFTPITNPLTRQVSPQGNSRSFVCGVFSIWRAFGVWRLCGLVMLLAAGCDFSSSTPSTSATTKAGQPTTAVVGTVPTVVATTGIIADVATLIAGDAAHVTALMGPGVDPHLYQPTARDLQRLKSADLVLYNGLHLEGRMAETLEVLGKSRRVVAVAKAIAEEELLGWGQTGGHDPHIWLDVSLWKKVSILIGEQLAEVCPTQQVAIRERLSSYVQQLDELHLECKKRLSEIPERQRVLITSHDAFQYFGRAYGLEVIGLQGISTESEAGLRSITDAADVIRARQIAGVFPESSVSHAAIDRLVADSGASTGRELYSDALGPTGSDAASYIGMIRANVTEIVSTLKPPAIERQTQLRDGKEG